MTSTQYIQLAETEQLILLCTDGVDLNMVRNTSHFIVRLYAIENFYVELFFHKSSSLPFQVNVLEHMEELDTYLESIDVQTLLPAG